MGKLRSGLELKKDIIKALKRGNLSLRKLETKLNTNNRTILIHVRELEYLGIAKIIRIEEESPNGRAYSIVELTNYGKKIKA